MQHSLTPTFLKFLALCALATALLLARTASAIEFWIYNTGDLGGLPGGSTNGLVTYAVSQSDTNTFDAIMRSNAVANAIVHIARGIYSTRGVYDGSLDPSTPPGFRLRSGVKLWGAGMGSTTNDTSILLVDRGNTNTEYYQNSVINSQAGFPSSQIEVSNLFVNCNGGVLGAGYIAGVSLWGGSNKISDVTVANARHSEIQGQTENFILSLNASTNDLVSVGNLIHHCIVNNFTNSNGLGACSAISLNHVRSTNYIQGIVEDCEVYLNGNSSNKVANGGEFAYNAECTSSCVYRRNKAFGAQRGFNNDTPFNDSIVFYENDFTLPWGTCYGYLLMNGRTYSRFYSNTVRVVSDGLNSSSAFRISGAYYDASTNEFRGATNLLLDHNHVFKTGNANPSWAYNFNPTLSTRDGDAPVPTSAIHMEANDMDNQTGLLNAFTNNDNGGYMYGNTPTNANHFANSQPNRGWQFSPCRADFDHDGKVDLIVQNAFDAMSVVYAPTNVLRSESLTPSGVTEWKAAGTGDFDRDGRTDVILQSAHTNYTELACWFMKGTASTLGVYLNPGTVTNTYKVVGIGDFDNDGNPDLLMQDNGGSTAIWYMDGTTQRAGNLVSPQPATNYFAVGTGDFNHDGKCDILWQYRKFGSSTNGALVVWYMDGYNLKSGGNSTAILDPLLPDNPYEQVVATADFNNDGYVDIVFQDFTGGTPGALRRWFMKGTTQDANLGIVRNTVDTPSNLSSSIVRGPR
jgi:hypothetical protein